MDTRRIFAAVLDDHIGLAEFAELIERTPFPRGDDPMFRQELRLLTVARSRLLLWERGAPASDVIASLRIELRKLDGTQPSNEPDPLEPFKRRFAARMRDGPDAGQ